MAALLDVVREWQQELRNGIAWVAFLERRALLGCALCLPG